MKIIIINKKVAKALQSISIHLLKFVPGFKEDIQRTDVEEKPADYISGCLFTAFISGCFFFILLFFLNYFINAKTFSEAFRSSLGIGLGIFFLFSFFLIFYIKILAGKKAEQIEKNLIFSLKDLLLQISSSVSLYDAMVNLSKSKYGQVSKEFDKVVRLINTGMPMEEALNRMAKESKSEYLRRTVWQLINTLKAGASLKTAVQTIIAELTLNQRDKIIAYARELNLWTLLYMLFAVAVPTIGAVMLVILGSFVGFSITKTTFVSFIFICFFVQLSLIGLMKARRPIVQF